MNLPPLLQLKYRPGGHTLTQTLAKIPCRLCTSLPKSWITPVLKSRGSSGQAGFPHGLQHCVRMHHPLLSHCLPMLRWAAPHPPSPSPHHPFPQLWAMGLVCCPAAGFPLLLCFAVALCTANRVRRAPEASAVICIWAG